MNSRPCGSAADALRFISANYVENYSAKIESRKELTVAADDAVTGLSAPDGYHYRTSQDLRAERLHRRTFRYETTRGLICWIRAARSDSAATSSFVASFAVLVFEPHATMPPSNNEHAPAISPRSD